MAIKKQKQANKTEVFYIDESKPNETIQEGIDRVYADHGINVNLNEELLAKTYPQSNQDMGDDTNRYAVTQAPQFSKRQLKQIEEENAHALKQPIKRLGEVGDKFTIYRTEYTILDRTDQYMLVEVRPILYHAFSEIKDITEDGKQKYDRTYWQVGSISVYQDNIVNAFGVQTGAMTERKEHIRLNPNIEINVENSKGIPIPGKLGFNVDKDRVTAQFNEVVQAHDDNELKKFEMAKTKAAADKKSKVIKDTRAKQVKELNDLRKELLLTLSKKGSMKLKDMVKDKSILELTNQLTVLDLIAKEVIN